MKSQLSLIVIIGCVGTSTAQDAVPPTEPKPVAEFRAAPVNQGVRDLPSTGDRHRTSAAKTKPFRYSVSISIREHTGRSSYEMVSFSLPIAEDVASTAQLQAGNVAIAARAAYTFTAIAYVVHAADAVA